jgi:hypothetical protein
VKLEERSLACLSKLQAVAAVLYGSAETRAERDVFIRVHNEIYSAARQVEERERQERMRAAEAARIMHYTTANTTATNPLWYSTTGTITGRFYK